MKPESSVINVYGTKNISIAELHKMGSSSLRNINNVNRFSNKLVLNKK